MYTASQCSRILWLVASSVRLIHLVTFMVVIIYASQSQHQNSLIVSRSEAAATASLIDLLASECTAAVAAAEQSLRRQGQWRGQGL